MFNFFKVQTNIWQAGNNIDKEVSFQEDTTSFCNQETSIFIVASNGIFNRNLSIRPCQGNTCRMNINFKARENWNSVLTTDSSFGGIQCLKKEGFIYRKVNHEDSFIVLSISLVVVVGLVEGVEKFLQA